VVMAVPSGCMGATTGNLLVTVSVVTLNDGMVRRSVSLMTLRVVAEEPSWINHMGSPAIESCMAVGRQPEPEPAICGGTKAGEGSPATRSAMLTELISTWSKDPLRNMLKVHTNAS